MDLSRREPHYYEDEGKREAYVSHSRHGHEGMHDEFKGNLHHLEG